MFRFYTSCTRDRQVRRLYFAFRPLSLDRAWALSLYSYAGSSPESGAKRGTLGGRYRNDYVLIVLLQSRSLRNGEQPIERRNDSSQIVGHTITCWVAPSSSSVLLPCGFMADRRRSEMARWDRVLHFGESGLSVPTALAAAFAQKSLVYLIRSYSACRTTWNTRKLFSGTSGQADPQFS